MLVLLFVSVVCLVLVALIRSRNRVLALVAAPGLFLILMSWLFLVFGPQWSRVADGSATNVWQSVDVESAAELAGLAGGMLVVGAAFGAIVSPPNRNTSILEQVRLDSRMWRPSWILAISGALTAAFAAIYGVGNLIDRTEYLATPAIPALSAASGLLIPSAFTLAVISIIAKSRFRLSAIALIVVQVVLVFATASRVLAILPVLVIASSLIMGARVRMINYLFACSAALLGSIVSLKTRSSTSGHGLSHYLSEIATIHLSDIVGAAAGSLSNVVFAVPLMRYVADAHAFTSADLLVSANPALGSDAGWHELAGKLRVNAFIPFNGLGELASLSSFALGFGCALLSFVVAMVTANLSRRSSHVLLLVALTLYFLTFVLLLEYNLRSSFRITYATVGLSIISLLFARRPHRARSRYRSRIVATRQKGEGPSRSSSKQ